MNWKLSWESWSHDELSIYNAQVPRSNSALNLWSIAWQSNKRLKVYNFQWNPSNSMIPNTNLESSCRMQELLIQYFKKRWVRLHILLTLPFECYRCPASVAMWGNLCASTVPGYSCSSKSSKLTPSATRRRGKLPPLFIQEFRNFSLLLHSKIKKQTPTKKIKETSWEAQPTQLFLNSKIPASDKALSSDKPSYSMRYAQTKAGLRETPCTQCTRSVLLAFFAWQITGWRAPVSCASHHSLVENPPPAFNVLLMYWVAPRSVRNLCLKCVSGTAVTSLEAKLQTKTSSSFGLLLPGHARAAANTSSEASSVVRWHCVVKSLFFQPDQFLAFSAYAAYAAMRLTRPPLIHRQEVLFVPAFFLNLK